MTKRIRQRFKPSRGSATARASTRSISLHYGHTIPLIPGKINLYGGVHGRIERAGEHKTFVDRYIDKTVHRVSSKIKSPGAKAAFESLATSGSHEFSGTKVSFKKPKVQRAQVRGLRRTGAGKSRIAKDQTLIKKPRKPRRPRKKRVK